MRKEERSREWTERKKERLEVDRKECREKLEVNSEERRKELEWTVRTEERTGNGLRGKKTGAGSTH